MPLKRENSSKINWLFQNIIKVKKQFVQMKYFWFSVLFGPQRKLSDVEKEPYYRELFQNILVWLGTIIPIPWQAWEKSAALKYPYSEIFVFRQNGYSALPKQVVVKRFIIKMEKGNRLHTDGLKRECDALTEVQKFSGICDVFSPKLYGFNERICCMATSHLDGVRFINLLLEIPFKRSMEDLKFEKYKIQLNNLGCWLRRIHTQENTSVKDEIKLREIVDRDIEKIKLRLENLKNTRPIDFPTEICNRIMKKSHEFAEQMLTNNPTLRSVHGDFSLVNVLYHPSTLGVIDFANFGIGIPEDDLSRIFLDFVNIDACTFRFARGKKGFLWSAFLSGYGKEIDISSDPAGKFHLLKHAIINTYMYTVHWGNRQFLNPFFCRLLYSFQRKFILNLIFS